MLPLSFFLHRQVRSSSTIHRVNTRKNDEAPAGDGGGGGVSYGKRERTNEEPASLCQREREREKTATYNSHLITGKKLWPMLYINGVSIFLLLYTQQQAKEGSGKKEEDAAVQSLKHKF